MAGVVVGLCRVFIVKRTRRTAYGLVFEQFNIASFNLSLRYLSIYVLFTS